MIRVLSLALAALLVFTSPGPAQVIPIGGGGSGGVTQTTGTCTPTVYGSSVAGVTSYLTQNCSYVKTGSLVVLNVRVRGTLGGTAAGDVNIGGLPFTIANTSAAPACSVSASQLVTLSGSYTQIGLEGIVNTSTLVLRQIGSGQVESSVSVSGWGGNAILVFSCSYETT